MVTLKQRKQTFTNIKPKNPKRIKNRLITSAKFGTMGLFMLSGLTVQSYAITPYQADYKFKINKKYSGVAKRTLSQNKNKTWTYSINAKAGGIASANQTSVFTEKNGKLYPHTHDIEYKILFAKIITKMNFDYRQKRINVNFKGKNSHYAMPKPAQDALTSEIQVREDMLMTGKLRDKYYIADKNKIKKAVFKNLGKETISVPAGSFEVVKIKLLHKNPKRQTFFYLSPKHDYLPIKVYQNDKGKIYDFQLKKLYPAK